MASSDMNTIEYLITCIICDEPFEDPRLLSCSHTYCRKCIEQMASANKDQFECPLRDETLVAKKDIDSLPLNQIARDLVELYGSVQRSKNCSNCDSATAQFGCGKCENERFCSECYQTVHTPKVMQKHQRVAIDEKLPEMTSCKTHPVCVPKYWCHTCGVLVCPDCLLFEHKDHKFTLMNEVANELELKMQNDLQDIQSALDYRLYRAQRLVAAIENDSKLNIQKIKETMASLRQMIDEHEKKVVQQILTIEIAQKKDIEDCKIPLRNELQNVQLRKATLEMLLATKDHTKILQVKQEFDDYVNKINEMLKTLEISIRTKYQLGKLDLLQELRDKILQFGKYVEYSNPELEKLITDNGTNHRLN